MKYSKEIKHDLKTIFKKGDLYDVIALKEHRSLVKNAFIKANILVFSRILYSGIFLGSYVKSHFAPVEEIKNAQENIRKYLGIPIDVMLSKKDDATKIDDFLQSIIERKICRTENELFIAYQNEGVSLDSYTENLRKILEFIKKYKISWVLLKESDLLFSLSHEELSSYNKINRKGLLKCSYKSISLEKLAKFTQKSGITYDINDAMESDFLVLDFQDFSKLILQLENARMDIESLLEFQKKVKDRVIQKAIQDYMEDFNLEKLKNIVEYRLTLLLNEDNIYKNKEYGKIIQNVQIKEEYVRVSEMLSNGDQISTTVFRFYDFLDVRNQEELLEKIKRKDENVETYILSYFYLYLCKKIKWNLEGNKKDFLSFYDYIYACYEAKCNKKINKIPGLYHFNNYFGRKVAFYGCNLFLIFYILCLLLLESTFHDKSQKHESQVFQFIVHDVPNVYINSCILELKLCSSALNYLGEVLDFEKEAKNNSGDEKNNSSYDFYAFSNDGHIGDVIQNNKKVENIEIAKIVPLQDNVLLPNYYAKRFADTGFYLNNGPYYSMTFPTIPFISLEEATPLFEIEQPLSKDYILKAPSYLSLFWNTVYPLGDDYVITNIKIKDLASTKEFYWDGNDVFLTEEVVEYLTSMESPTLVYRYGISDTKKNAFVNSLHKYGTYTEASSSEIRNAIMEGLELDIDATNEEIFNAIQNKEYSRTPIKDAHLTKKIKEMDEIEYYKTIASLDSLVCNLAATLAVASDDELYYTVGFLENGDASITLDESHAWALDKDGNIIDITPSSKSFSAVFADILDFICYYHLPLYLALFFISLRLKQKFGKKIIFTIKLRNTEKILISENIDEVYAKLNAFLYGGIHIPLQRSSMEYVAKIKREFSSYTKEELKEIKKELELSNDVYEEDRASLIHLANEIPFIYENADILQRKLEKMENQSK